MIPKRKEQVLVQSSMSPAELLTISPCCFDLNLSPSCWDICRAVEWGFQLGDPWRSSVFRPWNMGYPADRSNRDKTPWGPLSSRWGVTNDDCSLINPGHNLLGHWLFSWLPRELTLSSRHLYITEGCHWVKSSRKFIVRSPGFWVELRMYSKVSPSQGLSPSPSLPWFC